MIQSLSVRRHVFVKNKGSECFVQISAKHNPKQVLSVRPSVCLSAVLQSASGDDASLALCALFRLVQDACESKRGYVRPAIKKGQIKNAAAELLSTRSNRVHPQLVGSLQPLKKRVPYLFLFLFLISHDGFIFFLISGQPIPSALSCSFYLIQKRVRRRHRHYRRPCLRQYCKSHR